MKPIDNILFYRTKKNLFFSLPRSIGRVNLTEKRVYVLKKDTKFYKQIEKSFLNKIDKQINIIWKTSLEVPLGVVFWISDQDFKFGEASI